MIVEKIGRVVKNPKKKLIFLASKGVLNYDDEKYLKFIYKERMNKNLNLDDPQTFNEKLQWLKLYDRNPLYTKMVDKYEVREYIKQKIGEKYLIPLLGVYDSVDEIDFDKLPNRFVLKTTHDSGTVVICRDKENFDRQKAIKKLKQRLKRKYFYLFREWPYNDVKPRIIAEEYMEDNNQGALNDYKFYCFDGKPKLMFVVIDRDTTTKTNFYDMDFNKVNLQQCYPNFDKNIKKPKQFDQMVKICEKLSKNIPHIRVDFYIINNKVYFGELTFFDAAGMEKFNPEKYDEILGQYINLDKAYNVINKNRGEYEKNIIRNR